MKMKSKILGLLSGLAFMAMLALNVNLVQSQDREAGLSDLTLEHFMTVAIADGDNPGGGGCSATSSCFKYDPLMDEMIAYGSVSCSGTSSCTAGYENVTCDNSSHYCTE